MYAFRPVRQDNEYRMGHIRQIHFIGIGGVGMGPIAEILHREGYVITGSDKQISAMTKRLETLGIRVIIGHAAENVAVADVVVSSTAIHADNPELLAARAQHIPVVRRAAMLAELMRFRYGIAIAGTHGKTTTTSLVASLLAEGRLDPTFVIGGQLLSAGSNAHLGASPYLVVEADESDASFLHLHPMMTVVTNIDSDHMETYHNDFGCLCDTFLSFIHQLPFYGLAVLCQEDATLAGLRDRIERPVLTYGFDSSADIYASDCRQSDLQSEFLLRQAEYDPLEVTLNLAGKHNVLNALAAITIARSLGVSDSAIVSACRKFKGVGRRMQHYGQIAFPKGAVTLIDDYGHHPNEVQATVAALRGAFPNKRLVMIYQPHRYSRTHALFEDFVRVLTEVDVLILLKEYSAGEQPIVGADSRSLAKAIRQRGAMPMYADSHEELFSLLDNILQAGDVLITQGAGDVGSVPGALLNRKQTTEDR